MVLGQKAAEPDGRGHLAVGQVAGDSPAGGACRCSSRPPMTEP